MAPRNQRMPSMKELQDLLEALDAEGGLDIVGMDETGTNYCAQAICET